MEHRHVHSGLDATRVRRAAVRGCLVLAGLAASLGSFPAPGLSQTLPPDLREDFETDPRPDGGWSFSECIDWDGATGVLRSTSLTERCSAYRAADRWVAGTMSARLMLVEGPGGVPPRASLVFARDPKTGASRWVRLTAGSPGSVALGQSGTIDGRGEGTYATAAAAVPAEAWLTATVEIDPDGVVTVEIDGVRSLRARAGARAAAGGVGIVAGRSRVVVDSFSMSKPRSSGCSRCHDGRHPNPRYPLAADVFTYWDGTWWDTNMGGLRTVQQGGHGDPGGARALDCTGANGCHDLTTRAALAGHLDGVAGGRGRATRNTYHLRPEFFTKYPANNPFGEYGLQVAFDNYCSQECHAGLQTPQVEDMRHVRDTVPTDPGYNAVELGTHLTRASTDLPMDSDLSSAAAGGKNFAPCVSCHDPHGTSTTDTRYGSNRMLRDRWISDYSLCYHCHLP